MRVIHGNIKSILVLVLSIPSFLYIFVDLLNDSLRVYNKISWIERPFIFVKNETVVIYVLYTSFVVFFSYEVLKENRNNFAKISLIAAGLSLLLFWFGLLFNAIGITTTAW